jgi:hypothetical protein
MAGDLVDRVTAVKKYDTVVSSGQSALKAFLTMNGGAAVAFLAFIGHMLEVKAMPPESVPYFVAAMQLFISGTFLAVFAYGTIFLTNCLSSVDWLRSSAWMFAVTLIGGFGSLLCFVWGSWQAVEGFRIANVILAKP